MPFFNIFYNNINNIAFIESKADFFYKILKNGLKFQNISSFNDITVKYEYNKNIIGINDMRYLDNLVKEVDFLLTISFENFALVFGTNQLDFFNDFKSLNDEDIKKLSNQWWVYLLDYWKAKLMGKDYEYDSACEVFPLDINLKK